VSAAGDAYSFGITLVEILVGKAPTASGFGVGKTLPDFVLAAFPERIEQVLDPALLLPIEEPDVAEMRLIRDPVFTAGNDADPDPGRRWCSRIGLAT
jgi:hypothetical protein